jgi:hypothetical protein
MTQVSYVTTRLAAAPLFACLLPVCCPVALPACCGLRLCGLPLVPARWLCQLSALPSLRRAPQLSCQLQPPAALLHIRQ